MRAWILMKKRRKSIRTDLKKGGNQRKMIQRDNKMGNRYCISSQRSLVGRSIVHEYRRLLLCSPFHIHRLQNFHWRWRKLWVAALTRFSFSLSFWWGKISTWAICSIKSTKAGIASISSESRLTRADSIWTRNWGWTNQTAIACFVSKRKEKKKCLKKLDFFSG